MVANVQPIFGKTPLQGLAQISAANTNRDGSGTIVDLCTAGADGAYIERVEVHATVTTTAGVVRLYEHNGSAYRLIDELLIAAVTPSATVAAFDGAFAKISAIKPWYLPSGWKLAASTEKAETFNVRAVGAQLS